MSFTPYRLLPMGSYPRVADKGATHDLYGPVNRFVCTGYDRAQVAFLACLKVGVSGFLVMISLNFRVYNRASVAFLTTLKVRCENWFIRS